LKEREERIDVEKENIVRFIKTLKETACMLKKAY